MTTECLNNSLTPLDWVKEVRPPGASAGNSDGSDRLSAGQQYVKAPRKPPPVPIDLNANLAAMESRHYRFVDEKPPYSYASLIIFAINSSVQRRMTLSQIYEWIASNFIYYKDSHTGWKNSIRHNLSLNKCFRKVSRPKGETGKGSYWEIDHSAVPQKSPDADKPPLTPDSSAGSDVTKISPGPSPTLTELNRGTQHNSSLSSNELSPYHLWDTSSPGASRSPASFYPSSSNPSAGLFATPPHPPGVQDSATYQSPRLAFSDFNIDISESFSAFYHTLVNSSLGLSDFFKMAPHDPSLGMSSCGHSLGAGMSQHLSNLMQLAEDIQMKHGLEANKVEELSHAFNRGQLSRFGLADKEFDVLAGSFRKFMADWRKTPQSSMHLGTLPAWPPPVTQTSSGYGFETQSIETASPYMCDPPPQSLSQVNQYLVHPSTIQATAATSSYPFTVEGAYTQPENRHLYLTSTPGRDFPQHRSSPLLGAAAPSFDNVPIPESSEGVPVEALEPTFRPESPEYFDGFERAFQDACS